MKSKLFLLLALLSFVPIGAFAQNITVKGTVVDSQGETIIGATVVEKGNTGNGVTTDLDGHFTLSVGKGKKLVILGAGGAATAIQVQCALDGATSISIFNPDDPFLDRAKGTAAKLKNEVPDCNVQVFCLDDPGKLKEEIAKADILVNGRDETS